MTFSRPENSSLSARLLQALTPEQGALLRLVADEAFRMNLPLYIVGGFARDLLLDRSGLDFDLVAEGDAIGLARLLAKKHGGRVTVHAPFGTAQWFLPESLRDTHFSFLDLISARSETYAHPGALPTVKRGTLYDDLRRRDFTINTLAIRLDGEHFGELYDELGGAADLKKGLVRVLHPGSYRDDPTRILRAVRYEQRYGFRIADEDLDLIAAAKSGLGSLSGERLRHELDLTLAEQNAASMLARLEALGILAEIHPSLKWNETLRPALDALQRPEPDSWKDVPDLARLPRRLALGYLVWLPDLDAPAIESLAARLDFTASLREALLAASSLWRDLPSLAGAKPSAVVTRLEEVPLLALCALSSKSVSIRLSVSESAVESASIRLSALESVDNYLSRWRYIKPKTSGHTLKKLGLTPGPVYQSILQTLKDAWLDGEISSPEQEDERLRLLLEKLSS